MSLGRDELLPPCDRVPAEPGPSHELAARRRRLERADLCALDFNWRARWHEAGPADRIRLTAAEREELDRCFGAEHDDDNDNEGNDHE